MTTHPTFIDWHQTHADEVDALVLDVDGVLLVGREAAPGAASAVEQLRDSGVPLVLLTNDGSSSPEQRCRGLARAGLEFHPEEVVSCSDGLVELVQDRDLQGALVFVAGRLGEPCFAAKAGLRVTRDLSHLPDCAGVVVGEQDYDWEPTLNAIINYCLRRPDGVLVIPNPDSHFVSGHGQVTACPGAVLRLIQHVLERCGVDLEPVFLGKPHQPIYRHAHALLERRTGRSLARERVLTLGDSLESDVRGARQFGYRSGLVLTGVTDQRVLDRSPLKPDLVFGRLAPAD